MSDVILTGLTRLETSRLRFELISRDGDPFVESEVILDGSLSEVIASLQALQMSLYPTQPGGLALVPPADNKTKPSRAAAPRTPKTKADKEKSPKTSGSRTNVNWFSIVESLLAGELDEYVCSQKSSSAPTTKSNLLKKFPGLDVEVDVNGATADISVRLGNYNPDARAHA